MSFDALQDRLNALQETTAQVKELIDRLARLDFQPGSVPLPENNDGDDENAATELSAEINQILREEEEDLELLVEEVTDLRGGKDGSEAARRKDRLKEGVGRLEGEVKSCRIAFHKAQLTARRSLEAARRLERQILLQSYTKQAAASSTPSRSGANSPAPSLGGGGAPRPRRRHHHHNTTRGAGGFKRDDDPVVAASSDLTQSLHAARQIVQDELARSMALHESLQESTVQMKQLGGTYHRMEDMLTSSRDLLGVLMKSTKSDTWYLETTFYMLAVTLGWLIFRRWLYGPLWWLVWLPLRIVFRTGSTAVSMAGGKDTARMQVVDGAGKRVEVEMGEGAVPTVQVGGVKESIVEGNPDSMVEKVGRIVDGEEQPATEAEVFVPASDGEEITHGGRVRDEL